MNKTQQIIVNQPLQDEQILVVEKNILFHENPAWLGLKTDSLNYYIDLVLKHKEFHPRSLMEVDANYKQIIPYLIFSHNDRFFLMQRQAKATEQRLKNKYTLGIGGHIRQEDMVSDSLFDWARREFHEEVDYQGNLTIEPMGIINDDSNEVGLVHLGFVFLLQGDSSKISVKSELKSGVLMSLQEGLDYKDLMESWSQIVFDALLSQNK